MAKKQTPTPATDAAARLADEQAIDLSDVEPTGATGIVAGDVQAAVEARGPLRSLKKGAYTFDAPGYLGGVRVTLRAGEPVARALFDHVPTADHDLFGDHAD